MLIFDKVYKVDPKKFIEDLSGVFKFRNLDYDRVKGMVFLCCPFHNNGLERTPSANFSLVNTSRGAKEGDFYCFGCKTKGHISSILVKLFGDKTVAKNWVERMYGNLKGLIEEKREHRRIEIENEVVEEEQKFELDERAYEYETTYYSKRGISDDLVKRFKLGYLDSPDESKRRVYMPVFNAAGEVVFFQTRNIHSKSFYLPKGAKKVLWAGNEITGPEVVVCESIFNALTCWKNGFQAVATFGTGDEQIYEQLLKLPCRHYILAQDNDEAGNKGRVEMAKALRGANRLVSTVIIDEPGKDLNDFANLEHEEFMAEWSKWYKRGI